MKYRTDIDGLRALAILAVLTFHMFPKTLSGGFTGVDIFFIISGYLIGSTIFKEYESRRFSFLKFYQRRLIRIIPLLLIVLISTFILGYFFLLPQEFMSLGKHVSAASLFGSNFILLKEVGYFNTAAELKPLLHLWSLGIEEQFYLILPLMIVVFGRNQFRSKFFIFLLIVASFIYCNHLSHINIEAAFFRPESRFWELLLGVFLSKFEKLESLKNLKFRSYSSVLGLGLCLFGILYITAETIYPGYWALVPTIGASLIIFSGENSLLNKKLFSNPIIVFVGRISYSLYLWHWVLLSFNQIIFKQNPSTQATYLAVLVAFVLSIITFYFVEKPLKSLTSLSKKIITITCIAALVLTYNLGRGVYKHKLEQASLSEEVKQIANQALDSSDMSGTEMIKYENWHYFKLGTGPKKIIVLGDSHTGMYYSRIKELVSKDDPYRTIYFFIWPGCIPLTNVEYKTYSKKGCNNYYTKALAFGIENHASELIIASNWLPHLRGDMDSYYLENGKIEKLGIDSRAYKMALENLDSNLKKYSDSQIKIDFISSIPFGAEFNPNKMFKRSYSLNPFIIDTKDFQLTPFNNKYSKIILDLKTVALKNKATVVDPIDNICDKKICKTVDEQKIPIFCDDNHFRKNYAEKHVKYLDFIFNNN